MKSKMRSNKRRKQRGREEMLYNHIRIACANFPYLVDLGVATKALRISRGNATANTDVLEGV